MRLEADLRRFANTATHDSPTLKSFGVTDSTVKCSRRTCKTRPRPRERTRLTGKAGTLSSTSHSVFDTENQGKSIERMINEAANALEGHSASQTRLSQRIGHRTELPTSSEVKPARSTHAARSLAVPGLTSLDGIASARRSTVNVSHGVSQCDRREEATSRDDCVEYSDESSSTSYGSIGLDSDTIDAICSQYD